MSGKLILKAFVLGIHTLGMAPESFSEIRREGKDQESIQSSTRPDPGHHMGK